MAPATMANIPLLDSNLIVDSLLISTAEVSTIIFDKTCGDVSQKTGFSHVSQCTILLPANSRGLLHLKEGYRMNKQNSII